MNNTLHLRLFEADCISINSSWNTRHVQSSFWRFYRNAGDGASLELETEKSESETYPLAAGRLYFVPAGVHFHCRNVAQTEHFYIHFDVIGLPRTAAVEMFPGPVCLPSSAPLEAAISQFGSEVSQRSDLAMAAQCRLQALLYEAFALGLDSVPPERMKRSLHRAAALEPVLPAVRWIEANLSQPLANAHLAGLCCLSEDYFIRRFRECVGQSPAQYIQEQRVTRAAQMLLFTAQSIEQIAEEMGFGSRYYFTRIFARYTGTTPAAYRKVSRV
jgi:AraC-like DNA-binding protein